MGRWGTDPTGRDGAGRGWAGLHQPLGRGAAACGSSRAREHRPWLRFSPPPARPVFPAPRPSLLPRCAGRTLTSWLLLTSPPTRDPPKSVVTRSKATTAGIGGLVKPLLARSPCHKINQGFPSFSRGQGNEIIKLDLTLQSCVRNKIMQKTVSTNVLLTTLA